MRAVRLSGALFALMAATTPAWAQATQSPSQTDMKAKVHGLIDAMNSGDLAKAKSFYADDGMVEDPAGSPLKKGSDFLQAMISRGIHYDFAAPVRGTNVNQAVMDVRVTIGQTEANAVEIFTFNPAGRITGMKAYVELPGAMQPAQIAAQAKTKSNLQGLVDAVNKGDAAKAKTFYADGATIEDPVGSTLRKADAFVDGLVGRKVTYEFVTPVRGTNSNAAMMDVKVHVGAATVNAIEVFSFDDAGKISNMKAFWGAEDRQ